MPLSVLPRHIVACLFSACVLLGFASSVSAEAWPLSAAKSDADVSPVRVFKLSGPVVEVASPMDLFGSANKVVFGELIETIARETKNPQVKTMIFKFRGAQFGFAQFEELAAAMNTARKAGKRVLAHLRTGMNADLIAATAADEVHLTPEGNIFLTGLRAEVAYYKELLDNVGIRADIEEVGKFKSAPEPYQRASMSDAARQQLEALLDGLYDTLVSSIASHRKLSEDRVKALIDIGLFGADDAVKNKLVDKLTYWSDLVNRQEKKHGKRPTLAYPHTQDKPELDSIFGILELLTSTEKTPDTGHPRVALLIAEGPIVGGRAGGDLFDDQAMIASDDFIDALREIEADPLVKAIVVRVNSPGGSALASDLMWRELVRVDKKRPVVVSMGNVAASGGYYIASAARTIFAERATITGSIGVFGGKMVFGDMLDKVGVSTTVIDRGRHAGLFSPLQPFSPSERAVFRKNMEQTYSTFINRVRTGRNMSYDAVDKIAQGRVWTGEQARQVGLVDTIGGLRDAIAYAAKLGKAKADKYDIVRFPRDRSFLEQISGDPNTLQLMVPPGASRNPLLSLLPGAISSRIRGLVSMLEMMLQRETSLTMLPYRLTIQ
ncbi:MAG: protease-4 [Myxococcota bacterium]|jgi:protease-4